MAHEFHNEQFIGGVWVYLGREVCTCYIHEDHWATRPDKGSELVMSHPKPSMMPNHTKELDNDPLKIELEAAFGINLVTPVAFVKKDFVRKPHLTDRPLKNNPGLLELKQTLVNKK